MRLKKVYSKHFPFKGYTAMTIFPWIFIREDSKQFYTPATHRHEVTHALQQAELLWIFFFILYRTEYLIKLLLTFSHMRAYLSISFEQEANEHEAETYYNSVRKHYNWVKYIFKLQEA